MWLSERECDVGVKGATGEKSRVYCTCTCGRERECERNVIEDVRWSESGKGTRTCLSKR